MQQGTLMGVGQATPAPGAGYKVIRQLGVGPDGSTVLAENRSGEFVELRLLPAGARAAELEERALRLDLARHPSIRRLHDVEPTARGVLLVLEPVPVRRLLQHLDEHGPMSPAEARGLLTALAEALVAAHRVGLVHGNLDPSTISLDRDGRPVLDFTGAHTMPTAEDPRCAACRAPELRPSTLALLQETNVDAHALGALIVVTLTGEVPTPEAARALSQRHPWAGRLAQALMREDRDARPAVAEILAVLRTADDQLAQTLVDDDQDGGDETAARVGTQLGRFTLTKLLGEGAMGAVYQGMDLTTGDLVAVKVLKGWALQNETVRFRFRKEARVLAEVRSPYVANLVEASFDAGVHYMALEFVEGGDLAKFLEEQGGRLDEKTALRIVADVCRALSEPHQRGIIHRDLKPENVLITPVEGGVMVKVVDFGIARTEEASGTLAATRSGSLLGTPFYMSPEQCGGGKVTPASDVYALGATLYELLAGEPPFVSDDASVLFQRHLTEPAPAVTDRAAVSDSVAALVASMLAKDPLLRPADAAAVLESVEGLLRGEAAELVVHPRLPADAGKVRQIRFQWDLVSTPAQLWPHVSNTERMNAVVGLPPVEVERVPQPDGQVRTFLGNSVLGVPLRWEEFPFEWVEGHRWAVLRVFEKGPLRWYVVFLELEALPSGGTRLHYVMRFEPHSWFGLIATHIELRFKQRPMLEKTFKRIDAKVAVAGAEATVNDVFALPPALTSRQEAALRARLKSLREEPVAERAVAALEDEIRRASVQDLARIRPLVFARKHDLDEQDAIAVGLFAVKHGIVRLLWDVVCPLCQIPSTFHDSLAAIEEHAGCSACNLEFPMDLASSVELVLRVDPAIRENDVEAYCVGGPAHSPHVAAQVRLAEGERFAMQLQLEIGVHRLRCTTLPGTVSVEVTERTTMDRAEVVIDGRFGDPATAVASGVDPRLNGKAVGHRIVLAPGAQAITLRNATSSPVVVRLERTAARSDALTAARAAASPIFRRLFPGESLKRGQLLGLSRVVFLGLTLPGQTGGADETQQLEGLLQLLDGLGDALGRHGGSLCRLGARGALAVFDDGERALRASLDVLGEAGLAGTGVGVALHLGAAVATTINGRLEYLGDAVTLAQQLLPVTQPGELFVTSVALEDPAIRRGLPTTDDASPELLHELAAGLWGLRVPLGPVSQPRALASAEAGPGPRSA